MSNIDSDLIRGNIDTIILKTMVDSDKYGLDIIKEVETRSNGTYELKQPTLYSCLKRLENQELISSYWLDSDIGGKRHYYKLTEKGKETLHKKQEEWSKSKFIIDNLLSNFNYDEYRLVKKDDYDKIIDGKQFEYSPEPVENSGVMSDKIPQENLEQESKIQSEQNQETQIQESYADIETSQSQALASSETQTTSYENEPQSSEQSSTSPASESQEQKFVFALSQAPTTVNPFEEKAKEFENGVQQDILNMDFGQSTSSIDDKINEFSKSAQRLYDFESDGEPLQEDNFKEENLEQESQKIYNSSEPEPPVAPENEQVMPYENSESFTETEQIEETLTTEEEETYCLPSQKYAVQEEPQEQYETFDDDDEFLSELSELQNENSNAYFSSYDNINYSQKQASVVHDTYNNPPPRESQENFELSYDQEEAETEESNVQVQENNYSYSDFDSIISETANIYKQDNSAYKTAEYESFRPSYTNENYKQKLSNLSEYAKSSEDFEGNQQIIEKTKDINALKEEFEKEGIQIKQYQKSHGDHGERNYLLINKLNLIKSLILLAGYVFVLSALYIILNNTSAREMYNFSIKYFLLGFIPFIVYAGYYLVIFIVNPYKKVPAKYSPRITLFIAVIITVQLLLITYCVNLQLGFYSFSQSMYNHLLWIVPLMISFAPIISNLIHISLFYSKNFNV